MGSFSTTVCHEGNSPRAILRGDYPDPSVLRDGDDYYLTHSPFLYTPVLLIWRSRDLVHWKPICRAMTKVVGSAMAPDLVKHQGKFYIYFPAAGVNWVIWAKDIRGPWSDPIRLDVGMIDPGHVVDEKGQSFFSPKAIAFGSPTTVSRWSDIKRKCIPVGTTRRTGRTRANFSNHPNSSERTAGFI